MTNKKFIANRIENDLVEMIDELLPYTDFSSRTAFFRAALQAYCAFIIDNINEQKAV